MIIKLKEKFKEITEHFNTKQTFKKSKNSIYITWVQYLLFTYMCIKWYIEFWMFVKTKLKLHWYHNRIYYIYNEM